MGFLRRKDKDVLKTAQENTEALSALRDIYEGLGENPTSINETQKQALDILAPEEAQKPARRVFIALLGGAPKDYIDIIAASVELHGWDALAKGDPMPQIPPDLTDKIIELSSSINGHRAKEIVEVARSTQPPEKPKKRRGLLG